MNELVKVTDNLRLSSNNELSEVISRIKERSNLLVPESMSFGLRPELKLTLTVVSIDTNVNSTGSNRDVYKTDSGTYALHLSKLMEISQAGGMQILDSRILERATDEEGRVVLIHHQIKWKRQNIDGSYNEGVTVGKYDYYRDKEKYRTENQTKARRAHAEALAEGNALTRSINKCIAKLASSMSLEELKKPFVVPRVVEDPNALIAQLSPESQAKVRELYVMKQLGILNQAYPQQNTRPYQPETQPALSTSEVKALAPAEKEKEIEVEEDIEMQAKDFAYTSQEERTKIILKLVSETGYIAVDKKPITKERIETVDINGQVTLIEKLLSNKKKMEEAKI